MRDAGREGTQRGQLVGLTRRALQCHALADVGDEGDSASSFIGLHEAQTYLYRELAPILPETDQVETLSHRPDPGSSHVRGPVGDVAFSEALGNEELDRLSDQLRPRMAEHGLRPGIEQHDASGRVRGHDALGGGREERPRQGFAAAKGVLWLHAR